MRRPFHKLQGHGPQGKWRWMRALGAATLAGTLSFAAAQSTMFPIQEPFMTNTAAGWTLGGGATLTGNGTIDTSGNGWLRLTNNGNNQTGYAFYGNAFSSAQGVIVDFDFTSWGGSGADGISFFLFDGATATPRIGAFGGSLGYAQKTAASGAVTTDVPGVANGYVGIGLDEYGNYSTASEGRVGGGTALVPDSVAIRGPGNGAKNTDYPYLTGAPAGFSIDIPNVTARPAQNGPSFRHARLIIQPNKSTTVLVTNGFGSTPTAVISNYTLTATPPSSFKLGFGASTGGATNYHEIRNLSITAPTDLSITKTDGVTSVLAGSPITYTITVKNNGQTTVNGAAVADNVPASVTGVTWTCAASAGSACGTSSGSGNTISTAANLAAAGTVTYTVRGTVAANAGSPLNNTATVTAPAAFTDTNTVDNTATDSDTVTYDIIGTVFEDVAYVGGAGRSMSAAGGVARPNVRVELYTTAGVYSGASTTDATGRYNFSGVAAGTYTVRVVNSTVTSSRTTNSGATYTPLAVQTFRTNSGTDDTARVGGENPALPDSGANTTSGALSTLLGATSTAQSISSVTVGSASSASNVDFGFNFDTVVNKNDSGQGSLRQFIQNADALSGADSAVFMIPDGAAHPGLRSGLASQLTNGVAVITPATALPAITDANTTIDGTTQTTNIGDTNSGQLGTGGTVGVDNLTLSKVNKPEVQIVGTSALGVGLDVQASNVTVRGISIYGFGSATNNDVHANIRLGNNFVSDLIEQNFIGISATRAAFDCPTGGATGTGDNVRSVGADNGTLRNNLIGCAAGKGFGVENVSNGWIITGNELRGNAIGNNGLDGIDLETGSASATIQGNLIVANSGVGVDGYNSGGGHTIQNNTISANSAGNGETANIRLMGAGNTVYRNILQNAVNGPGVMVVGGNAPSGTASTGNKISQNSFGGNAKNAIDLASNTADITKGDGITLNDGSSTNLCGYLSTSGNRGLDYPTIVSAILASSGATTVRGTACPSSTVEVYRATAGTGDTLSGKAYGEGAAYLGAATTDTSGNWTLSLTGVTAGTALTSIVIDASNNTSEFSANVNAIGLPSVTLSKTVRNCGALNPVSAACPSTATFSTAASGKPNDVLEYCIAYNNIGNGAANALTLSDPIVSTTAGLLNGYATGLGVQLTIGTTTTTLTSAADTDAATLSATNMTYGPVDIAAGATGSVCFRAQIK